MISNIYISNLCTSMGIVSPTETITNAYDFIKNNPDCFGLCMVENEVPVGIITKEKMALKLSGYHGFSLYQNKTIDKIMDKNFLEVDHTTPVSVVSSMATARSNDKLYDFIIVTENDKYIGIVTIKDLLQKTTEIEISEAKHQNPLLGLPGNLIIEQKLSQCLENDDEYWIIYFDIDNFKAYNDVYGFEKGDLVIKLLADILSHSISGEQFIGHVGGDDFVIILDYLVKEDFYQEIEKQFEHQILSFYNKIDICNGYITTSNRRGEVEQCPLMTLTSVLVEKQTKNFKNVYELTQMLARLKKKTKLSKTFKLRND